MKSYWRIVGSFRSVQNTLVPSIFRMIQASSIVFIGTMIVNVLNYAFTLVLGHLLTPEQFGELVTLLGIVLIFSVVSLAISTIMASYTAGYQIARQRAHIWEMFLWLNRFSLAVGSAIGVVLIVLSPYISHLLKVGWLSIIIVIVGFPVKLTSSSSRGALQGMQAFVPFSMMLIIETACKLGFGLFFTLLGWAVSGVMCAVLIGFLVSLVYGVYSIRTRLRDNFSPTPLIEVTFDKRNILSLISVAFWATLFLALFTNMDVILVKYFVNAHMAGQYAAMATFGKIVTFGTLAIVSVMLPMVSASRSERQGSGTRYLWLALSMVGMLAGGIMALFIGVPRQLIQLTLGNEYLAIVPHLKWFGLGLTFIAFGTVFIHFFIAVRSSQFIYSLPGILLVQLTLISQLHDDLHDLTLVNLWVGMLFLAVMLGNYFLFQERIRAVLVSGELP